MTTWLEHVANNCIILSHPGVGTTDRHNPSGSGELVQESFCLFQIGRVEAFSEPAVNRRQQLARLRPPVLFAPQPREADGGAQFPELGLLLHGDAQGFVIKFLGGLGMPLTQKQLAFVSVQLCRKPALAGSFDEV